MKTLQEHFTTPEQARDLLELGVPVGSADCYRLQLSANKYTEPLYLTLPLDHRMTLNAIPCWSVGRLIEIYNTCVDFDLDDAAAIVIFIQGESPIVQMMEMFEDKVDIMAFSNLEE